MKRTIPAFFLVIFCLPAGTLPAQDPDIEATERAIMEDIYRSSDEPGEIPTGFRDRHRSNGTKRVSVPDGAFRVGCICMDDSPSKAQSIGACSGHGENSGDTDPLYRIKLTPLK